MQGPFGRYELVRPLDHGGMGEVWLARARGPERVQKTVVLKRIRAERRSDDAARARFAEEARVAISLSHPHIVPVFEFGELDGTYFLVMEWLRGGNLARIAGVERAPLPWAACALIGTQLCDALAYVHARANKAGARLVHGDVTPRNVLFSTDGHALLADFGLARFAGRGGAGTLRYQAPEQARGEAFDARADLYALALVLSEAATGRPAYDRDAERAAKQARVGVIPDFAGCDDGLASVLRRALAASADGRFADAAAMRAAFEALLDREPGARAAGRGEIVARSAAPAAGDAADATRTATQATREATVAAAPSRWTVGIAGALVVLVGGAVWLGAATRHRSGHAQPYPSSRAPSAPPTSAPPNAPPTSAATSAPPTSAPPASAATSAPPTSAATRLASTTAAAPTGGQPTSAASPTSGAPGSAAPTSAAPASAAPASAALTSAAAMSAARIGARSPPSVPPTSARSPTSVPPTSALPSAPPTTANLSLHASEHDREHEHAPARRGEGHAPRPTATAPSSASAQPALLDVNASPWAHVRVDGTPRGETPLLGLSLPPGAHTIELSNEPLGVHRELTVTLQPGEHARRVEDLSR